MSNRLAHAAGAPPTLVKETHEHTLRIAPPLVIGEGDADWIAEQATAVLV